MKFKNEINSEKLKYINDDHWPSSVEKKTHSTDMKCLTRTSYIALHTNTIVDMNLLSKYLFTLYTLYPVHVLV